MNENLNIQAIHSFKNSLQNYEEYGFLGFKQKCLITYSSKFFDTKEEILMVYFIVNGANPAIKIDVENNAKILISDFYHLDFEPKFSNTIRFNNRLNALKINGKSNKMGEYQLIIKAID